MRDDKLSMKIVKICSRPFRSSIQDGIVICHYVEVDCARPVSESLRAANGFFNLFQVRQEVAGLEVGFDLSRRNQY